MTDTVPGALHAGSAPHWLVTYAKAPSGVAATPAGATPTGIVAVTKLDATLMTETEPAWQDWSAPHWFTT